MFLELYSKKVMPVGRNAKNLQVTPKGKNRLWPHRIQELKAWVLMEASPVPLPGKGQGKETNWCHSHIRERGRGVHQRRKQDCNRFGRFAVDLELADEVEVVSFMGKHCVML
jgi:hypothetical protein